MSFSNFARRRLCIAILSITAIAGIVLAQDPQRPADQPEVIRISTELVQTGVVVLDKQGKFVDGLKPEQFLLKVDGKPVTPSFFEQVTAGTTRERNLEAAAARGVVPSEPATTSDALSYRGRTIVFFIDDLHLSATSVVRTREALIDFVDKQMGSEDRVAVASASGQIGFLQQFTDVKPVLRAAISRVTHKPYTVRDAENIAMTEYQALRIEQGDKDATDHYVEELLKATNFRVRGVGGLGPPAGGPAAARPGGQAITMGGMTRGAAERMVKERALVMLRQAASVTTSTLVTLDSLMRSSSQMSGRKLVFFVSDGFFLNDRNTAFADKLRRITDAAVRAGVVIYSIDARGLVSSTDASSNRFDSQGRLSRSNIGELAASQDALSVLAADTGGRAFFPSGPLSVPVTEALKETSNYYLLAWRPSAEDQKGGNFRKIEVSVVNRPELTVRLPRGFLGVDPGLEAGNAGAKATEAKTANAPPKSVNAALVTALSAPSAREGIPTQLSVGYLDVPNTGTVLTASMQMATGALGYGADGKQPAAIDLAGVILDDQGKQAGSFKNRINVNPSPQGSSNYASVIYSHKLPLRPGLYQVRAAARDEKSGRVGSDARWLEIPDLQTKTLTMSTLMVGGQFIGSKQAAGGEQMQFSVDRRFARGSHMNFVTIIYNAARGATGAPELEAQINISRNGQSIVNSPQRKVGIDSNTDVARVVYGADIALQTLPAGRYLLKVTISDRVAKTSAAQQVSFEIE